MRTDYLSDAGTDRVLAAINRHEDASERVDGALADLERIEREHQAYLRQTLDTIVAARIELLEMCLEEPILTPLSEFPPREIE